jgi:hypothetical protein
MAAINLKVSSPQILELDLLFCNSVALMFLPVSNLTSLVHDFVIRKGRFFGVSRADKCPSI